MSGAFCFCYWVKMLLWGYNMPRITKNCALIQLSECLVHLDVVVPGFCHGGQRGTGGAGGERGEKVHRDGSGVSQSPVPVLYQRSLGKPFSPCLKSHLQNEVARENQWYSGFTFNQ